jgi:hypothetical protein
MTDNRVTVLERALRRYGVHEHGCSAWRVDETPTGYLRLPCTCGLDEALAPPVVPDHIVRG